MRLRNKLFLTFAAFLIVAGLIVMTLYLLGIIKKQKKHHIIPALPILSHKCVYPDDPTSRSPCVRDTCYSDDDCTIPNKEIGQCQLVDCT
jgi:hypothetical protein